MEGVWNNKKERLKWLQDRLSKSPSSSQGNSPDFRREHASKNSNLRRGQKPPVPPVTKSPFKNVKSNASASDDSDCSVSLSSEEIEIVSSTPPNSKKKKHDKNRRLKKAHRVSLTVAPQPPSMLFAPPPMPPLFMPPFPYSAVPCYGMSQSPMAAPAFGQVPNTYAQAQPKKSNLKGESSEVDEDEDDRQIKTAKPRKKRSKKVRILDEKEAVDAETSTCDELVRLATAEGKSTDSSLRNLSNEVSKAVGSDTQSQPSIVPKLDIKDNQKSDSFDWDAFFAPRMAPPLIFGEPTAPLLNSFRTDTLSMLSNTKRKTQNENVISHAGQLIIETSNHPTPYVFQPAIGDLDSSSRNISSPTSSLLKDDRTVAWLAAEETTTMKTTKKDSKLTPIAEEVLRSYESLKNFGIGADDSKIDGELASANQRLARYFNQLRDLDNFILDQESKLLDRQHGEVHKKAVEVKPTKAFGQSPRQRPGVTIPQLESVVVPPPLAPPPFTVPASTQTRKSALLIDELYGSLEKSKDSPKHKPSSSIKTVDSSRRSKTTISGRFSTNRIFANYIVDGVVEDLLDEILVFEVGRVMQATSVEAVSALIERRLAEDLEEKRAFTQQIVEQFPPPSEIIAKATEKTEETVQKIVQETAVSINASRRHDTTPVEDVDLFFRELTLPKAAESIVKDVIDVDLQILIKNVLMELSITSVVDDFLINQVVGNEMFRLAAEALTEAERHKRRSRRRQMRDSIQGQVIHSMVLDICLGQVAQQSVILSPLYEVDIAVYDTLLQELLAKMTMTHVSRGIVAECLPIRRYHEKVVCDIAMDAVVNELIKSLDIDIAEVDDFETGRDLDFKTSPTFY